MIIAFVLAAVFLILAIVGGFVAYHAFEDENKGIGIGAISFVVVMVICLAVIPGSIHTVDTGEIAVVKHLGAAVGTRGPGTHFDFWMTESYQKYDSKVQNMDINAATYSSDAQTMNVQMTLQYSIMSDKVMDIANKYGSLEALQSRIQSIAIEKAKSVLSSHKAMDIISDRASMSPAVEEAIKSAIDENYLVNVTTVVLTNIDFSDAFEMAVEEKMIAEQSKLKAEYENETKVAKAEADAKAMLVEAQAEADAKLIAADAEKQANEMLEKSITAKILQKAYIDKWDGILPNVVAGDSTDIMVPVSGFGGAITE